IGNVKKQTQKTVEAPAPYREFTHIQVLPGDTTATLHTRLVNSIEAAKSQYTRYPNLTALSGFNDYLRGILWKEIIAKGIQGDSSKKVDFITQEDFISGKLRLGTSLIIHFKDLDEILGRLKNISYTPDVSVRLRKVDRDVINTIVPTEQNRNLIRSTLFIETYEYPNNKWYIPDGASRFTKTTLQESKLLQKIKKISSFGDFQIREIRGLASGFGNEWIRRDQLQKALKGINNPALQKYLTANSPIIKEDLARVAKIGEILKKPYPNDGDMAAVSENLIQILRIDPGDGSTIVGKIIGASLLDDKLNGHFQKLNGTLAAIGESIHSFWDDTGKMPRYEKSVFMINNRGEKVTTLGFAQNYLYRILENKKIIEQSGMRLKYGEIEFEHIGGIYGQVLLPDAISQRSIKYDTNIF
ncbi:MAG: hypothetical protein Q8K26_04445, partial [Candidatus Gracilibacteria bacterium]|nr:hypothetical protein [Candidatus Gracilibacteria bacterium]